MLTRKNRQQPSTFNEQQISTIIGEGFVFTGEMRGEAAIRIEGKIIGNVQVESGVILGEKGCIEGDIVSNSVIIFGTVHGSIKTKHIEIKKTGLIFGDITADTVEVEMGAKYNGRLSMQEAGLKEAS